ncbi:MAG: phage tail tape measure protein [Eggerthellaceae bacterium]|nr:phage tail tape measure protein [Eggerthellaceae bacterium]
MGTANVNIKIIGSYSGRAVERALQGLEKLNAQAAITGTGAAKSLTVAGTSLMEQGAQLENIGYKAEAFGERWLGVTAAVAAVGFATAKVAVDIDTSLTNVKKTVDGTDEQYQQLKQSAIEFSKTNAVAPAQILDIQSLGAQLGFAIDELDEMSRVTSGLDIATNMSAEQAATEMAQFANITQMAHDKVSNYGSAIVHLGNNLATTEADISSMSMRTAAASHQIGMSVPEILGWSSAMTSMGIEAEAGGTAFSTTVATIDKAVATGSEDLNTFAKIAGMSADEFKASWQTSASDTMVSLLKGTDSAENMTVALEEMGITGIRQTDVLKRLAGNTDLVTKALGLANGGWNENTALQAEVDNRNQSLASRFQILQNRVAAYAEEVGTPLVNALLGALEAGEPVLEFLGSAADAFANADEGTQQQILGLVALAAAFPPLMVVGGKYLQLVGSTAKAIGTKQRAMGALINLTRTDNVELLKRTATEGTFAQKLAITANAYAKRTAAVAKDTTAQKVSTLATKANAIEIKAAGAAVTGFGMKTRSTTAAISGQSVAMKAGSAAAKSFGLAVKSIAPIAAISLVIELATAVGGLVEKQQKYEKATSGLDKSTLKMASSFASARTSVDSFGSETLNAKADVYDLNGAIDASIERNAALADRISEIYSTAGTTLGMVQNYRDVISDLGSKTDMSAEDAAKLQLALDGVNQECGTSYQVSGNASEGYKIMADGAEVAKDEILKLIDAQKNQIRLEASKEAYAEAYKGLSESAEAAAQATANYNSVIEQYDYWCEEALNGTIGAAETLNGMAWQVTDAKKKMDEANGSYEAQKRTVDALEDSQTLYQMALSAGNGSIAEAVAQNDLLTAAFDNADKSTTELVNALTTLGVSTTTITTLTADETAKLAAAYDGTASSVSQSLYAMATNASTQGTNAGKWLTDNFSAEAQGAINAATDTAGLTTAQFKLIADGAGISGEDAIVALANSITNNSGKAENGARIVKQALVLEFTKGDVEAAARILGEDIDEGLANGITGSSSMPEAAVGLMSQATIDNAKTVFESHSPSQVMHRLGTDIDTGLANGIGGSQDQPIGAMGLLGQLAYNAISGLPGLSQVLGSSSGSSLASALGGQSGNVYGNASALYGSAASGIAGTPGVYSSTGSQAAGRFAGAIGSGSAYSQGAALASTGKSGMESVSANGAGANFVRGFGNGMGSINIWDIAWNIGNRALNAIKSALGIASPSKEAAIVGAFFDKGLIVGMQREEGNVAKQAARLESAMQINPKQPQWEQLATIPMYEQPGGYGQSGYGRLTAGGTVNYNYYSFGAITLNARDAAGVQTIDDVIAVFEQAAQMNPDRRY